MSVKGVKGAADSRPAAAARLVRQPTPPMPELQKVTQASLEEIARARQGHQRETHRQRERVMHFKLNAFSFIEI